MTLLRMWKPCTAIQSLARARETRKATGDGNAIRGEQRHTIRTWADLPSICGWCILIKLPRHGDPYACVHNGRSPGTMARRARRVADETPRNFVCRKSGKATRPTAWTKS